MINLQGAETYVIVLLVRVGNDDLWGLLKRIEAGLVA
jgi:hypothetical protein